MGIRKILWTAAATVAAAGLGLAEPVTVGPWRLEATPAGPRDLSYRGEPIAKQVTFTGFTEGWKAVRFALTDAPPAAALAEGRLTWTREVAGQAAVTLVLTLTEDSARFALEAEVQPGGPCEFGVYLAPESTAGPGPGLLLASGSELLEITSAPMPQRTVGAPFSLERPRLTCEWAASCAPGAFVLQDWRQREPSAFRLIAVMAVGDKPARLSASAVVRVTAHGDAEAARRARILFQRTEWRTPVEVPNAGFEEGLAGWTAGSTGAVSEDVRWKGARAARLRVSDPLTEPVYITRQVPVVGGGFYEATCRVRTEGVQARPGKMPSVGAGLIVEWATPDGAWFAGGEYACNLFGDSDWREVTCAGLRAPEEAGFAVIYLALRGAGTAWFDDITLTRVHRCAALVSPEPGASLADNTPTVRWRGAEQAEGFTVEFSPEPDFPAGVVRSFESPESPYTVRTPLAPGRWYWRVRAPGYDPSAAWDFEQTAEAGRDTAAPVLLTRACRVTEPSGEAILEVEEDAAPAPEAAGRTETLGLAVVRQASREDRHRFAARPQGSWQRGLNTVRLTLTDAAGNQTEASLEVVFQPAPDAPVTIGEDGFYEVSGQRIFPLGIYQVSPESMARVKAAGFEVVHTYQFESSQDDDAARRYLDAAREHGLRVFLGFDRGTSSGRGLVQGNEEHVIRRVAALCDHPALFCWYLFDEPEVPGQYVSPRKLARYAGLIRALDPYHPVVVTTWGNRMNRYRASWDTHWTQSYTTPPEIVRTLAEHRRLLQDASPITLLVHCFDRAQSAAFKAGRPVDPAAFQPDAAWLRAAAFVGITQQVNGLFWWWYAETSREYYTVAHVPQAWEALGTVLAQIRDLRPVITAPGRPECTRVTAGGETVEVWGKSAGGLRTVIAVHTGEADITADIPAPGEGPAEVLFEGREVRREGGAIRDRFGRYGVHVYRFPE